MTEEQMEKVADDIEALEKYLERVVRKIKKHEFEDEVVAKYRDSLVGTVLAFRFLFQDIRWEHFLSHLPETYESKPMEEKELIEGGKPNKNGEWKGYGPNPRPWLETRGFRPKPNPMFPRNQKPPNVGTAIK